MALVVLDAGVVIAVLNAADALHGAALAKLREYAHDDLRLPASALAEALVSPARRGIVEEVREAIAATGTTVTPLDEETAILAAALRARHRTVKLPDALVAATGDMLDADVILTTDRRLARLPRFSRIG